MENKSILNKAYKILFLLTGIFIFTAFLSFAIGSVIDNYFNSKPTGVIITMILGYIMNFIIAKKIIDSFNKEKNGRQDS